MKSLDSFARTKLTALSDRGLKRDIVTTERREANHTLRQGRHLISFCCNDYLNLSHHPKVRQAAKDAIDHYGAGAGASRLVTGSHPLIRELEQRLAAIKGTEDACVFSSGYMANIGIIPTLVSTADVIFIDELSHACLQAGSQLSSANIIRFHHNDVSQLRELVRQHRGDYRRAMIITDGVFSMDGDLAPLDRLSRIATDTDCWLMSDDAHGFGVIGTDMKGSRHMFSPLPDIPLQMGTLSKAIGSFGGYLCASKVVTALVKTRARSLIYTTALPPASAAAALAALDIITTDPDYCRRPMKNARVFAQLLGLAAPESPIIPIIIGETKKVMDYAALLEQDGFLITGIRPPTVAEGTARLRLTFCAQHKEEDIHALVAAIKHHGIV
ncbi:MAG: 8-amino-7-oxononanoate synthase [Alphaproteobacteria bacterium]|nr:8-amino-7-oxononanoate synthase [Alphaproteobacteria bacterium]